MGNDAVLADTQDDGLLAVECVDFITEIAGFPRSAGRVVFGVEIENYFSSREIVER